ncbi:MAG: ribonuclease Y [Candidatus Paceibacterota bacterium]
MDTLFLSFPFFAKQKKEIDQLLEQARSKAKEIVLKAREEALDIEKQAETAARKSTQKIVDLEKHFRDKESQLERLEKKLYSDKKSIDVQKKELADRREELLKKLEKIAKLTQSQAKELIIKGWEDKLKPDIAQKIKAAEKEIKSKAEQQAREILVDAMRYGSVDYVAEYTLSTIPLQSEDLKGRIIGKEGRNIRAFELATGVDVDLEEAGVIKLSSFDAVKREVARVAIKRLIKDGRIQPARIEEIVKKTKEDIDRVIVRAGEDLCHKVGVYDLPHDLVAMLGKFKYRYSYGQNMILHTLEETKIGTALAHELGADVRTVKLGCLLHDIGKIVIEKEGSHVQLGVELLKKYKIPQEVIDTVESHHEDVPFKSVEAVIVYVVDAVSGGRPGARHEDFEEYLKRIKNIEEAATKHRGVREAYALQAGRELRVIVKPEDVSEDAAVILAQKIKHDIEEKFPTFPGQVNITIIRETRVSATTHS